MIRYQISETAIPRATCMIATISPFIATSIANKGNKLRIELFFKLFPQTTRQPLKPIMELKIGSAVAVSHLSTNYGEEVKQKLGNTKA